MPRDRKRKKMEAAGSRNSAITVNQMYQGEAEAEYMAADINQPAKYDAAADAAVDAEYANAAGAAAEYAEIPNGEYGGDSSVYGRTGAAAAPADDAYDPVVGDHNMYASNA